MSPEAQLKRFIAKFTPEIAALAEAALAGMRDRFPNAIQLLAAAEVAMSQSASGRLVIKSVSANQRPRRPSRA